MSRPPSGRRLLVSCRVLVGALGCVAALAGASPAAAAGATFDRAFGARFTDLCTTATGCLAGASGATRGQLAGPTSTAVSGGEVYVADQGNNRVSVFTEAGAFVRAFGKNVGGTNVDVCTTSCTNGTTGGAAGQLNGPTGVAVSQGHVYVADLFHQRVSVFTTAGAFVRAFGKNVGGADVDVCTTTCLAGSQGSAAGQLSNPIGLAVSGDEVFVSDQSNHRVSVFATTGAFVRAFGKNVGGTNVDVCTTTCMAGSPGSAAGQLFSPYGVAVSGGEVYVASQLNRRVIVFTTAGTFVRAMGTQGVGAGQLGNPLGVAVSGGEVYVADQSNHRVSVFTEAGTFVRASGKNVGGLGVDICTTSCSAGTAGGAAGQLSDPFGVAVNGGEVFVADRSNQRVSVVTTGGAFTRAFGKNVGADRFVCTTATGCASGSSGGAAGMLSGPSGTAVSGGEVYVADQGNNRVSVFTAAGAFVRAFGRNVGGTGVHVCTTNCSSGSQGGAAGQLTLPFAVAVSDGEVYVTDLVNQRVSVFSTAGVFVRAFGKNVGGTGMDVCTSSCVAGSQGNAAGQLSNPYGLAVSGGEVYVVDRDNRRVSVFSTAGVFARAFGRDVGGAGVNVCTTSCSFGSTTSGVAGQLSNPLGVAVSGGEVYVADTGNQRVSVFSTAGAFARAFGRNVGGAGVDVCTTSCSAGNPGPGAGQMNSPFGVAVGGDEVYVAEVGNQRASVFTTAGTFLRAFGKNVGPGADVCTTSCVAGTNGGAAGQLSFPYGVALSGRKLYIADQGNARVSLFDVPLVALSRSPVSLAFGSREVDGGPTGAQTSTISNSGDEPVTLSGVSVGGADAGQFERLATGGSDDCATGVVLPVGETCDVRVRFDPTTTGSKAASVTVASDAPPVSVALSGTGTRTQLSRSPVSLAFAARDIDVGASATQSSTVTNSGTEPVTLTGVSLGGSDPGQFERLADAAGDCTASTVLTANQSCAVRVRFDPSTTGPKAATATVASNAPDVSIALSGTGTQTELSPDPATLPFGDRDIDDVSSTALTSTVTNSGTEPMSVSAVTVNGADPGQFQRVFDQAGDCTASTVLTAGQTCAVRVRFDPSSTGAKTASVTVASGTVGASIDLTGTGTQTELSRSPTTLPFGDQDIDDGASATQTSTVTNAGTEPVSLTGVSLGGSDPDQFERLFDQASDCTTSTTLTAGESCAVRVRIDPSTTGAKIATATLVSNAPDVMVALSGTGTQTELSRDPASLPFGFRDIDDGPSPVQSSTVTNSGSESVTLTGVTLGGADAGQFARPSNGASDCVAALVLAAGETCELRARFAPSSTGAKSASVTVTSSAADVVVALSGNGMQTELSRDAATLPFGARDIDDGASLSQTSTVTNSGSEPVSLSGVSLDGSDPDQFERLFDAVGDCTTSTTLAAGQSCEVRARFDPSTTGVKFASVTVASNAPEVSVALIGSGTQTELSRDPATLPFGARDIDDVPSPVQSSTLTNSGSESVTLTGVTLGGADAGQFERLGGGMDDCVAALVLAANQTCEVQARFDPSSTGVKSASVTVTSSAADVVVALSGSGTQTELSRDPSTLPFGGFDIGDDPSPTQTSTVSNSGSESVTLMGVVLGGADAGSFALRTGGSEDCAAGVVLPAGETCDVRVRFDPSTTGAKAASVTVASNAADVVVALTGSGIQTELTRSPTTLPFGAQDIDDGASATQSSTVTNSGTEPVSLSGVSLGGSDPGQFERPADAAGDCTASTVLTAGQSCEVRVRFDPSSTGAKTASATVASNAPDVSVALSGTGTQTELSPSSATLPFGARDIDDGTSAVQTSTVSNSGSESVTLTGVTLGGADAGQFERLSGGTNDCVAALVLAANATCEVRAGFDPSTSGAKAASITVTSSAADVVVALSGTGTQTELSRAPATLPFGDRDIDDGPSATQSSTVTNSGSEPVSLTGVSLDGSDAGQFERLFDQAGDCTSSTTLTAGQSCAVRVRFDPSSTGAKTASVTVASGAADVSVDLTGSGTQTELSRSPVSLTFAARDVDDGPSAAQSSTVTNSGSESVTLTGVTLGGADAGQFERLTGGADDCVAALVLGAGETCDVRARFDPSTTGAKTASVTVTSNAADVSVGLTGSGGQIDTDGDEMRDSVDPDDDNDTVPDATDAFPLNPDESVDTDGDGTGNVADTDDDGDGVADASDAFPLNPGESVDTDGDGTGNVADTDDDGDGVADASDAFPLNPGESVDTDGDGTGNVADTDDDGDGVADTADAFPLNAGESVDTDGDGTGNKADTDDDGDGVPDASDALPLNGGESVDTDGDGTGNKADGDDDGDGVADVSDAFPLDAAESADLDRDGVGNNRDGDDDGDGVPDRLDAFPLDRGRGGTPKPPVGVPAWSLQLRDKAAKVVWRRTGLHAQTGYAVVCPAGGPACVARLTLKFTRRTASGRRVKTFLTPKSRPFTVLAGSERRVTLRLSRSGARRLAQAGTLTATLRGSVRRGTGPSVSRKATLKLTAPRTR